MFKHCSWCLTVVIFVIIFSNFISDAYSKIIYKPISTDTGLIFYDTHTNKTILPPIVTPLKYSETARLPQIGRPCSCQNLLCGCCAGINFRRLNFSRKLCTNFTYDPNEFSIQMDVMMDENSLYSNMVSARNPQPVCIPIPVPYAAALNADMCIKLFNIFTPGRNLHMCMDFQARVQQAPVIVLHFDCMRMGQNGFALVKPEDNGGLDLTGDTDTGDSDGQSPPTAGDLGAGGGSVNGGEDSEPPQTDYDVYDEITEIKGKPS